MTSALAATFAAVFIAAALQSAWLMAVAVIAGPITAVSIGLSGLRRM
jgi:hypothetical protein